MERKSHRISVIVPVIHDTVSLDSLLRQLRWISHSLEVIVADGEKSEETRGTCSRYGAIWVPSPRGRGIQMNRGAAASRKEFLWFIHADVMVHPDSLGAIEAALKGDDTVGGAFRFRLHQRHWYATFLDLGVNLRSRWLKLPYGDQGFFVKRSAFESMGGYRDIPFLEDFEFIRRLRGHGNVAILSARIGVSSRRWEREGFFYATARNWLVTLAYFLGASPERLVHWYRPEMKGAEGTRTKKYPSLWNIFQFDLMKMRNRK